MPEPAPLLDRVERLADALRRTGVAVSTSDVIDAVRALGHVDLLDRETVRAVLRATLAKDPVAVDRFDAIFGRVVRQGRAVRPATANHAPPVHVVRGVPRVHPPDV